MKPPRLGREVLKRGALNINELVAPGGFEPPLRGPEPRVLPLDDPPPAHDALQPYHNGLASTGGASAGTTSTVASADGGLQRAARAKAGHARRRDLDLPARARVAPVAGGALGD